MNARPLALLSLSLFVIATPTPAAENALKYQEIYELLRTHLAGMSGEQLDAAAARGLIQQLHPRVMLVEKDDPVDIAGTNAPLVRSEVHDESFGYFRVGRVVAGLDKEIAAAYEKLAGAGKLRGLVLDLRYAGGNDYAAAATTTDWFTAAEQPLLDWGEGMKKSTAKETALKLPVAVLVNRATTAAAEALAGSLRQTDVALVLGTNTAGQASIGREFTLSTGQRLRVAVTPVKLGDGSALSFTGLAPDIHVPVSTEDERAYYDNAFAAPRKNLAQSDGAQTLTNRPARRRINEAELVRMSRDGADPENSVATRREPEIIKPVLQDPALARALDLLKGLSIVQRRSL